MGWPQETLDRDGSPVREFAFWLLDLRHRSGVTYEELARRAHYATSAMQAATAGRRFPTLRVTMAFVQACGGDERAWRAYWAQARRLRAGERHEYGLRVGIPAGQLMNSHYVHVPRRRSDHFELRIRFGDPRPPGPAWVVRAAPPPIIYQREPTNEQLTPDRFGDVSVSFSDLRLGLWLRGLLAGS